MTGRLLWLGLVAGLIAGVLAFGAARIWGEPPVAAAIALEEAGDDPAAAGHQHDHGTDAAAAGHQHDHGTEAAAGHVHDHGATAPGHSHGEGAGFSRSTQAGAGLLTGTAVYGTALGGLLALVFAAVQGRVSHLPPRATAALIALAGFVAVVLVPQLKYPANPPAVGHGETIGLRTAMFFLMLAISVAGMVLAVLVGRGNAQGWRGWLTGAAVYGAVVLMGAMLLPAINEVPVGFPGDLLWRFRTASLGVSAVLWGAVGLIFGWLVDRRAAPPLARA